MSKLFQQVRYAQVVRDIKMILKLSRPETGEDSRQKTVETNWGVGRYLAGSLYAHEVAVGKGSPLIVHLAREFSQPQIYFQTAMVFYQRYPDGVPENDLSWEQYKQMLAAEKSVSKDAPLLLSDLKKASSWDLHARFVSKRRKAVVSQRF